MILCYSERLFSSSPFPLRVTCKQSGDITQPPSEATDCQSVSSTDAGGLAGLLRALKALAAPVLIWF